MKLIKHFILSLSGVLSFISFNGLNPATYILPEKDTSFVLFYLNWREMKWRENSLRQECKGNSLDMDLK